MVLSRLHISCSQLGTICPSHAFPANPSCFTWHPLGIAFSQVSSSSRSFPRLCSGFAPFLLAFVSVELGSRWTSLPCTSNCLLAALRGIRKEIGGKNRWISLFSHVGLNPYPASARGPCRSADVPLHSQDLAVPGVLWWGLSKAQDSILLVLAGPGSSLSSKGRAWGKLVETHPWITHTHTPPPKLLNTLQ